jgi:hypothetical protein
VQSFIFGSGSADAMQQPTPMPSLPVGMVGVTSTEGVS